MGITYTRHTTYTFMFPKRPSPSLKALRMLMERQVALDLEIRERVMAQRVAAADDLLCWLQPLSTFLYVSLTLGALTNHWLLFIPIVPVAVFKSYIIDFAKGIK